MARKFFAGRAAFWPSSWRINLAKAKANKILYDRINGNENGEDSTKPQNPLRLGAKKTFRRRLRTVRVRVSKLRVRIKISPGRWLRKLCNGYVKMMQRVNDQVADNECLITGLHISHHMNYGIA